MTDTQNLPNLVVDAHKRIESVVRRTRLEHSPFYSQLTGANVYFKCENLQRTGSFKIRGAANKILSLTAQQRDCPIVAASTGNHGRAVATIAAQFGQRARIFVPDNADKAKVERIAAAGADVDVSGSDCIEAEAAAREFAGKNDACYISPYNDPLVVAGQGTIGRELCEQLEQIDAVFASLGGGGLISGVAACVKSRFSSCRFFGCSPTNSKVMIDSLAAGKLLNPPSEDTLSDGSAGGVESDSITFEFCRKYIDDCVSVSEAEIATSLLQFIETHNMLIEGAAAAAIAGMLTRADEIAGANVVVILCGANIGIEKIEQAISLANRPDDSTQSEDVECGAQTSNNECR